MKRHNFSVPYGDEVFGPIYLNFLEKDGVIWGIDARFSEMNGSLLRDEPGLVEALRRYSLPEVVSRLGDPQQILIGIENEPVEEGVYWTYAMWLDYSGRGVAIYYLVDTVTPLDGAGAFRVCPRLGGIEKIDLYMRAADGTHTLVEMTEGSADISRQLTEGDLRDSEAATGLSAGQFAYTLRMQGDDACFDAQLR
jgi:hypothetical protein